MRQAAKRDANESAIIDALERIGVQCFRLSDPGMADLLTLYRGQWLPIEVKVPGGSLTTAQVSVRATAPYPVVETESEALALFGVR